MVLDREQDKSTLGVDEKRISLGVDIFHHDLEAIEATPFGGLDFIRETLYEGFVDDSIRGGEEREDM